MERIENKYQNDLSKHNHIKNCIQEKKNTRLNCILLSINAFKIWDKEIRKKKYGKNTI